LLIGHPLTNIKTINTSGFSLLSAATDEPRKTTDLAMVQVGHVKLQAENTTDLNSVSSDNMDCCQSACT
jgi:hypothetical protein